MHALMLTVLPRCYPSLIMSLIIITPSLQVHIVPVVVPDETRLHTDTLASVLHVGQSASGWRTLQLGTKAKPGSSEISLGPDAVYWSPPRRPPPILTETRHAVGRMRT